MASRRGSVLRTDGSNEEPRQGPEHGELEDEGKVLAEVRRAHHRARRGDAVGFKQNDALEYDEVERENKVADRTQLDQVVRPAKQGP